MNEELKRACEEWAEAGQHGTVEERIARSRRWLAYYDMMAKLQGDSWNEEGTPTKIAEYLKQKGCISEQMSVLDIGAGCGSYTLPLARRSAWVRALDMSAQSLLVIRRRAQKAGIGNILCEQPCVRRFVITTNCGAWRSCPGATVGWLLLRGAPMTCTGES